MMERFIDDQLLGPDSGQNGTKNDDWIHWSESREAFRAKEKVPFTRRFGGIVMDSGSIHGDAEFGEEWHLGGVGEKKVCAQS